MTLESSKSELRTRIGDIARQISTTQRAEASAQVCAKLERLEIWARARLILFFAPTLSEMNIWPLVAQAQASAKWVALPRFSDASQSYVPCLLENIEENLQPGRYGIREPSTGCREVELNQLDLVLVPGVAFDLHGRRLGRGKGFYDRLLAGVRGTKCGIAFDEQIVAEVPAGPHDIHLNCILTPTRWIET